MKIPSLIIPAILLTGTTLAANCINTAFALVPTCAQSCILAGATSVGCGSTDFECQCSKTAALFAAVDSCVSMSCPAESYQAVIDGVDLVCECIAPAVLRRQGGTASVSGTVVNTATATGTVVSTTAASATSSGSGGGSVTSAATTTSAEGGQGNGATWTGYTSVSNVATASAAGVAARPTVGANMVRYVVPVAMAGAVFL